MSRKQSKQIIVQIIGYLKILHSMKSLRVFLLFFIASGKLCAQENLLSNSDFEMYKALPTDIGQGKNCLADWTIPVLIGGGDYYHTDSKSKKAGTAKNYFGKQEPHSGKAYSGICITKAYREYLQTELNKPLEKGSTYKMELFISCGDAVWLGSMKEFCVIFTTKEILSLNEEPLLGKPSIIFRKEDGYSNSNEWEKLEAVYEADGTEKFMTFGSFVYRERNESVIRTYNREIPGKLNYAHYFIDDFTLTPLDKETTTTTEVIENKTSVIDPLKIYETGKAHIFKNIVFESGKADLLSSSFNELNELAEYLNSNSKLIIKITGHTDNIGKKEDNLELSKNRAQTVLNFLKEKSISASRLSFDGKGDMNPISNNDNEEGRQINRRVEIVFQ
jgi:OOP family OmpA-OmpF porin